MAANKGTEAPILELVPFGVVGESKAVLPSPPRSPSRARADARHAGADLLRSIYLVREPENDAALCAREPVLTVLLLLDAPPRRRPALRDPFRDPFRDPLRDPFRDPVRDACREPFLPPPEEGGVVTAGRSRAAT